MSLVVKWSALPVVRRRFVRYTVFVAVIFLLLILRLWYLQIINHEEFFERSVKNRTRMLVVDAPRGAIYDRHGELIVDNRPSFQVSVLRQDVAERESLFKRLSEVLDVDTETLEQRWREGLRLPAYRPVPLASDVSREMMERVQEHSNELPGIFIETRPVRDYVTGGAIAHIVGYLGEITEEELRDKSFSGYRGGDLVGKIALERTYDKLLKGTKGQQLIEVDVRGRLLRKLQMESPRPGRKIHLTLDLDLQRVAMEAFGDHAGAAVAMDVKTGEVLSMVSLPTFDPRQFARGITSDEWRALINDRRNPLQNKAITGQYPPASTFKMIVALAALREETATPERTIYCDGDIEVGDSRFRCWQRRGHGETDMHKALRESCDVWFYQVGLELGIDKLSAAAREFGLGETTGFELPGERSGNMPTRDWKRRELNQSWYAGETVIASIGQGYILSTPLQLAVMTAALANGGQVLRPQIIAGIEELTGNVTEIAQPDIKRQLDYDPQQWQAVQSGMEAVVNELRGTGSAARIEGIRVAGKTGTSQVIRRISDEEEEMLTGDEVIPYRHRSHALFVAYAPVDDPRIAVAVVVEHGQSGGRVAAPIAAAIIENYLQQMDSVEQAPELEGL